MMIRLAAFSFFLLAVTTHSYAGATWCEGSVEWGREKTTVRIDISLPEKMDGIVTVASSRGATELMRVGIGRIEIRESVAGRETYKRASELYVTSLDTEIITCFFVEGIQVYVLRFSLKGKTVSYFDSFRERNISGVCE
ncbi:MAG: hypothetical protein JXB25_11105 [Deltaproteobacteria bacterium]|nr:hypothetical protein [Deltaproteobacteria bacterium]